MTLVAEATARSLTTANAGTYRDPARPTDVLQHHDALHDAPPGQRAEGTGPGQLLDNGPTFRWYYVRWQGRLLDTSTGDAEAGLLAVVEAMRGYNGVYGTPTYRVLDAKTFAFEVWIGSTDQQSATRATRMAIHQALERARVGDARPGGPAYDVMIMLEEWPTVRRAP